MKPILFPAFVGLMLIGLAACLPSTKTQHDAQFDALFEACVANAPQHLVGEPVSALEALNLSHPVRLLRPDGVATADYIPNRLNVMLDEHDVIEGMSCG